MPPYASITLKDFMRRERSVIETEWQLIQENIDTAGAGGLHAIDIANGVAKGKYAGNKTPRRNWRIRRRGLTAPGRTARPLRRPGQIA